MIILGVEAALWAAIGLTIASVTYAWAMIRGSGEGLWEHGPTHSERSFPILLQGSICTGIGFVLSMLGVTEMPLAVLLSGLFFGIFASMAWTHWKHRAEWPSRQKQEEE